MTPETQSAVRKFTESDVMLWSRDASRISCLITELIYDPPIWMKRGRMETSSGYGRKLNSGYKIHFEGRQYRIYVTIFGNSGTSWFKVGQRTIIVSAH